MAKYMLVKSKTGVRYKRDGKLASKGSIPLDVLERLKDVGDEVIDDAAKRCIVCSNPNPTRTRFVYMQVVDLCEDDYFNKRMGEVAQALRSYQKGKGQYAEQETPKSDEKNEEKVLNAVESKVEEDNYQQEHPQTSEGELS